MESPTTLKEYYKYLKSISLLFYPPTCSTTYLKLVMVNGHLAVVNELNNPGGGQGIKVSTQ